MRAARYDAVTDFYVSGGTDAAGDAVTATLLDLLGPAAGQRVPDVACGHGRVSRALARRGARVVGVDLSAGGEVSGSWRTVGSCNDETFWAADGSARCLHAEWSTGYTHPYSKHTVVI